LGRQGGFERKLTLKSQTNSRDERMLKGCLTGRGGGMGRKVVSMVPMSEKTGMKKKRNNKRDI